MDSNIFVEIPTDVIGLVSLLLVALVFVRTATKNLDDELKPERLKQISQSLSRWQDSRAGSWLPDFALIFDGFFGAEHLGMKCISRSYMISLVVFLVLTFIFLEPPILALDGKEISEPFEMIATAFMLAIFLNALPDYLSLLETRKLLNSSYHILVIMIVDVVLTFGIPVLWISLFYSLNLEKVVINEVLDGLFFKDHPVLDPTLIWISVATSFVTSLWLWFHGLAVLSIRVLMSFTWTMGWLNVEHRPIRALGTAVNIHLAVFGMLAIFIFFIWTELVLS